MYDPFNPIPKVHYSSWHTGRAHHAKRLRKAEFNKQRAEAQVELQAQVLSKLYIEKLAMKNNLLDLGNTIKAAIFCSENSTREDISCSENIIRREIAASAKLTQENILSLGNELKNLELQNDMMRVEHEIELEYIKQEFIEIIVKFNRLHWIVSFLFMGVAAILFKLFLQG